MVQPTLVAISTLGADLSAADEQGGSVLVLLRQVDS